MKNCKTGCFVFFDEEGCTFSEMEGVSAEFMRHAAGFKKIPEELRV